MAESELDFDDFMKDESDPIIPFGIHCGKYASQIHVSYLKWLAGSKWIDENLAREIRGHLASRRAE